MKAINSTKLPKHLKEAFLNGEENYFYNEESQNGYYILHFDMYRITCDKDYFDNVIKVVDFWNSLSATERHNYIKQYEQANNISWFAIDSFSNQAKKDFFLALLKVYNFIQPLDTDRFRDYINSDNVIKIDSNLYQTQCTQYSKKFTLVELQNYFIKEYQN